jgi:glycosidase
LQVLQAKMVERNMYLMLDIVLNHTSHRHGGQKSKAKCILPAVLLFQMPKKHAR